MVDLTKFKWEEIHRCLSLLTRFPVFFYDPKEKKPCAPAPTENYFCHPVHQAQTTPLCQEDLAKEVDLAIQTQGILFSKCRAGLNYFVAPIRIGDEMDFAIIGGKIYYSEEEYISFKREAVRGGLSSEEPALSMSDAPFGTEVELRAAAQTLQTIGTTLLKNIYDRSQYHSKTVLLTALLNIASQFKKDPTAFELNMSLLINTLGFLFDLRSAAVFHQDSKGSLHQAVAVFGAQKERLYRSEVLLDVLFEEDKKEAPSLFCDATFRLLKSKLPDDIVSCRLFPIFKSDRAKTTLAIFDTALTEDNVGMIASFCRQAGAVHENIELQNQLSQEKKVTQSFSDFTNLLGAAAPADQLHENILERASQLLHAEQGSLMLLDESKNELSIKAMKGVHKALLEMLTIKPGEGIAGQVYQSGNPLLVQNLVADARIQQKQRPRYKTTSFISVPLKLGNRTIGVINLADKVTGQAFSEEDLRLLTAVGGYISIALDRSKLHEKEEELKKLAMIDPPTGLLNRRYFQERLIEEVERTRRGAIPVSLMMIDIDRFKAFSDTDGAAGMDKVLKLLSRVIHEYIRGIDVVSRYGSEQFGIILPQTPKEAARRVADRIREGIEKKETLRPTFSDLGSLTVSIGLATFPDDAKTTEELIRNADRALYQATLQGKNKTLSFNQETFFRDTVR